MVVKTAYIMTVGTHNIWLGLLELVIGHGIGGIVSQLKWRVSLRPDDGVSDDRLVCHHPILRPLKLVMALRSKYVDATYYEDILLNS